MTTQDREIRGFIALFQTVLRSFDDIEDIPTRDALIMARVRRMLGVKDGTEKTTAD
jgi:hypothetical protein